MPPSRRLQSTNAELRKRKPPSKNRQRKHSLKSPAWPLPTTLLGGLRIEEFLRRHWQKKPLLVRQAFPDFKPFLTADELAGLACSDEVNSRLVIERGGVRPWQVTHGPLSAKDFKSLPRSHWTLLVTDVDKIVRPAADLLQHFNFIPSWRIDDLMISYAVNQGSVGPHLDSYDVFLLQAYGRRRWRISNKHYDQDDFIPGLDLRILDGFSTTHEWLLEPGDILYLPPGVAHHGIAEGECMSYSIGFRAPSHRELLADFGEYIANQIEESKRFGDRDLKPQTNTGEIGLAARQKVRKIVRAITRDDAAIDDWLGHYLTETGPWGAPTPPKRALTCKQFSARWARHRTLRRSDRCRFAHIASDSGTTLFVDGEAFATPSSLRKEVALVSGERQFDHKVLALARHKRHFMELLCTLYNKGYLEFE